LRFAEGKVHVAGKKFNLSRKKCIVIRANAEACAEPLGVQGGNPGLGQTACATRRVMNAGRTTILPSLALGALFAISAEGSLVYDWTSFPNVLQVNLPGNGAQALIDYTFTNMPAMNLYLWDVLLPADPFGILVPGTDENDVPADVQVMSMLSQEMGGLLVLPSMVAMYEPVVTAKNLPNEGPPNDFGTTLVMPEPLAYTIAGGINVMPPGMSLDNNGGLTSVSVIINDALEEAPSFVLVSGLAVGLGWAKLRKLRRKRTQQPPSMNYMANPFESGGRGDYSNLDPDARLRFLRAFATRPSRKSRC
jgi:hypothetical protein